MNTRYIPENSTPIERAGLPAVVYSYTDNRGRLAAISYIGKQSKHTWHFCFRTDEQRQAKINGFFDGMAQREDFKLARKIEKTCFKHGYVVGDILYSSWGYDQTNIEFYEVLATTEKTVTLCEIAQNGKSEGFMCEEVTPRRGEYIGKPFTRSVKPSARMGEEQKAKGTVPYSEYPGGYTKHLWWHDGTPKHSTSYA
jgi:hypothetical protein